MCFFLYFNNLKDPIIESHSYFCKVHKVLVVLNYKRIELQENMIFTMIIKFSQNSEY